MKTIIRIFCLIIITVVAIGCASSKKTNPERYKQQPKSAPAKTYSQTSQSKIGDFSDTTVIYLNQSPMEKKSEFVAAVEEFNAKNFSKACPKFKELLSAFPTGDSLNYETSFMNCECLLQEQSLNEAEKALKVLLGDKRLPSSVRERVLLRLGHIACAKDEFNVANGYFSRLEKEFPKSPYLKIANCKSIKK